MGIKDKLRRTSRIFTEPSVGPYDKSQEQGKSKPADKQKEADEDKLEETAVPEDNTEAAEATDTAAGGATTAAEPIEGDVKQESKKAEPDEVEDLDLGNREQHVSDDDLQKETGMHTTNNQQVPASEGEAVEHIDATRQDGNEFAETSNATNQATEANGFSEANSLNPVSKEPLSGENQADTQAKETQDNQDKKTSEGLDKADKEVKKNDFFKKIFNKFKKPALNK